MSFVSLRSYASSASRLYIGRNRKGQWIVRDEAGNSGGIFLYRRDALRFATSRQSVSAVFFVPGLLELVFSAPSAAEENAKQPGVRDRVNGSANAGMYDVREPAECVHECRSSDADPHRR